VTENNTQRKIKIALVGAGMFGGDVHLRAYADVQTSGIVPFTGRIGLDHLARELADVQFELVAIATRTEKSAQKSQQEYSRRTGYTPKIYFGDAPWDDILRDFPDLDVLAVATPDNLHTAPVLAALNAGAHVVVEKPMCMDLEEADAIIAAAQAKQRVVCVDMHKRYDPDHLRIHHDIKHRIGAPLYGRAILEEPLEVSTSTFKWAEQSDPFSYVGPHWTDLFHHYYGAKPIGLTAVGQKKKLIGQGINAYDAVQVRVDWDNGMSIYFQNNWINPADFEGNVNQEHEIVGAEGKVESDQQYRGFRFWTNGGGSRTANNHFTRDIPREASTLEASAGYIGYGTDSIHAGLVAACRIKFSGDSLDAVKSFFPTPESARITTAIVHAARIVRDRNFEYSESGKAPAVSASFESDGIYVLDPHRAKESIEAVREKIYDRAL
jgi:predicted dehydrogenase